MHDKCVAYTFQQNNLKCILHSRTDQGQKYFRGKQTGLKKNDFIQSLPEISFCSNENRRRRCRREPKCHHVNCLRRAQDFWLGLKIFDSGGKLQVVELKPRINGYDAGFEKDEFDCNLDTCECAHFNQYVIGNNPINW